LNYRVIDALASNRLTILSSHLLKMDRKNQARRGEQDWGLARRDARGGVLVRCAEREENRFGGV
jgi:hypothetical protein